MTRSRPDPAPIPPRLWWIGGIVVTVLALLVIFGRTWLAGLHDRAAELNGPALVAALTLLPLIGFPVSVLHALTGARFGWAVGMAIVAASIAVQMTASYAIVRLAPDFFARRFAWLRERLPPGTHRSLTLFTILLPGAPYFAQNYTLAVAGVPFRLFFSYAFPLNVGRSFIGLIFGEWSGNLTPGRMTFIAVYAAGIMLACGLAFRRLRAQLKSRRPAAGGRKQPA
jgi:uncharacterized membrane protein YdjX (TVP38/TMEM64 family)